MCGRRRTPGETPAVGDAPASRTPLQASTTAAGADRLPVLRTHPRQPVIRALLVPSWWECDVRCEGRQCRRGHDNGAPSPGSGGWDPVSTAADPATVETGSAAVGQRDQPRSRASPGKIRFTFLIVPPWATESDTHGWSTADQDPQLQLDTLSAANCLKTYTDTATGTKADRPQWNACLADLRRGDTFSMDDLPYHRQRARPPRSAPPFPGRHRWGTTVSGTAPAIVTDDSARVSWAPRCPPVRPDWVRVAAMLAGSCGAPLRTWAVITSNSSP